jgi:hypothetical protein
MDARREQKKPVGTWQPKGYWTETDDNGEPVYCHKTKHRGETVVIRKTLREIAEILNQAVRVQNEQKT